LEKQQSAPILGGAGGGGAGGGAGGGGGAYNTAAGNGGQGGGGRGEVFVPGTYSNGTVGTNSHTYNFNLWKKVRNGNELVAYNVEYFFRLCDQKYEKSSLNLVLILIKVCPFNRLKQSISKYFLLDFPWA
jgi:hypothetical protein